MGFNPLDIFTNTNAQNAADAQSAGIAQGKADATTAVNTGTQAIKDYGAAALVPYTQNYTDATKGTDALGNALGLNGPTGNVFATAAFWNNPAIQSQLDIGSENVKRSAAAVGGLQSGGTLAALDQFGQQVASNGWNNYISQLSPYLGASQTAAAGIGNTNMGIGSGVNANQTGLAQLDYTAATDTGKAQANADLAQQQADQNFWNVGMNVAKLATGAPTSWTSGLSNFLSPSSGSSNATANSFASNPNNLFPNYGTG